MFKMYIYGQKNCALIQPCVPMLYLTFVYVKLESNMTHVSEALNFFTPWFVLEM